jgi:hypothetical protein
VKKFQSFINVMSAYMCYIKLTIYYVVYLLQSLVLSYNFLSKITTMTTLITIILIGTIINNHSLL